MQPNDNQNDNQSATTGPTPGLVGNKVRKLFRPDRASPYLVQWGCGKERKTESYASATDRNRRYNELIKELGSNRRDLVMTKAQIGEYFAFKAAIKDTHWVDVVSGWREYVISKGRSVSTLTVDDAVNRFRQLVDQRLERGELAAGTACQKRQKAALFARSFRGRLMSEVTTRQIEKWLEDHAGSVPGTYNSYRKHIAAFFEEFRKEVRPNPVEEVETRDDYIDKVEVLSPEETARLFGYALQNHPDALGRLALEAFMGLRFGSAFRLEKTDINFAEKGIMLPRHIVKTRRRFYVDGMPDNMWTWVARTNDACWTMENNQWMHMKSRLFTKAGVPHPRNCLRHSFATYHVAAFKNPGLTSAILCHRNQQKLWQHYNGVATQAAGRLYFSITPDNWRQVAEPTALTA